MKKPLRIGTRKSPLALWQAEKVAYELKKKGKAVEIVGIDSLGDLNLKDPLDSLGQTGVFTKALDQAILEGKIDAAVHSLKDVATQVPEGLCMAACLQRGPKKDVLVLGIKPNPDQVIATGSPRRKAQWLHKFPSYTVEGLRGNVQTRIQKIHQSNWEGGIMAEAGLKRMELGHLKHEVLNWMYPAPSQGIVSVFTRDSLQAEFAPINNQAAEFDALFERSFLRHLEGGCAAPIGVNLIQVNNGFESEGVVLMPDGSKAAFAKHVFTQTDPVKEGIKLAEKVLEAGGEWIMSQIRKQG